MSRRSLFIAALMTMGIAAYCSDVRAAVVPVAQQGAAR